ncbi:MAG TPA: YqcC family protein [Chitinophagaceae bacterium]|jgi:uncharacterized protein YqcC (DUF446 family)|nr:YqcC family protein [Chitinophagaceae bacterium]
MKGLTGIILAKITELEEELKSHGFWQVAMPPWVYGYDDISIQNKTDFAQWLQFVFIPNHTYEKKIIAAPEKNLLVPHAVKFFGNDLQKGKLIQILIEIDELI